MLAQKHDNIWLFGYDSNDTYPDFGGSELDFSTTPPGIFQEFRDLNFNVTNASMCDTAGNLLFYTNGISIANHQHQIIENGNSLNPGEFTEDWIHKGYPLPQGVLILPFPNQENQYILLHAALERIGSDNHAETTLLYGTLIDMSLNSEEGSVIYKNQILIQDTLEWGKLTATKHANGRDWWIIVPEFDSNRYYRLLLSPKGVENLGLEHTAHAVEVGLGQAVFSPDGTKYVRNNLVGGVGVADQLDIYDFDRCTGLLSNHQHIIYADSAGAGGVAISPNSRYLYVSHDRYLFQYDLETENIAEVQDTVAEWDGFVHPPIFATRFFLAQLGPNNKIYINTSSATKYLHIIHQPNEAGLACEVEQRGVELPTFNAFSMPNFPNYRLGALEGSPCDSIVSNTHFIPPKKTDIYLYPNPATNYVKISASVPLTRPSYWQLYNGLGQVIKIEQLPTHSTEHQINLENIPNGMYFYNVEQEGKVLKSGKLFIQK